MSEKESVAQKMSEYLSLRDLLPGSFESDGEEEESLEESEVKKDQNSDDEKPDEDKLKISPSAAKSASSPAAPPPPTATPACIITGAPPHPTPIAAAAPPPPAAIPKAQPIPIRKRGISGLSLLLADLPPLPAAKTGISSNGVQNASPDPTPIAATAAPPPPTMPIPTGKSGISALLIIYLSIISHLLADLPPFSTAETGISPDMASESESEDEEDDEGEFIPPHEFLARRRSREACPCFSMLSGKGRTLKGRDLVDTRDMILRLTGFL